MFTLKGELSLLRLVVCVIGRTRLFRCLRGLREGAGVFLDGALGAVPSCSYGRNRHPLVEV
jgi:hypothetical protein